MSKNNNTVTQPARRIALVALFPVLLLLALQPQTARAEPTNCNAEPEVTPMVYGEFYDGGNCSISSGDIDVLTFEAKAGDHVFFNFVDQSGSSLIDFCVTLLDPVGVPTTNGAQQCAETRLWLEEWITVDGVYTITLEETDTGAFPYAVAFGRLAPQVSPLAPALCNGCTTGANIVGGGDVDEFLIAGAAGDVVTVQVTDLSGSSLIDICSTIYDSSGTSLSSNCAETTSQHDPVWPADDIYTVIVRENDTGAMNYNVVYQCLVGTCPVFDSPDITTPTTSIDFGETQISTSSSPVTVTLTGHSGDLDAEVASVALSGANPAEYSISDDLCSGEILADAQTCTFDVVFNPMTVGELTASVEISTNDQAMPITTVSLTGEGTEAALFCIRRQVTIQGTGGDDILIGTSGPDVIHGLGGNDIIYGLGGNDRICGGDGRDVLLGGEGNDRIVGNEGPDMLLGEGGNDILKGGAYNDYLNGGDGDDHLDGQFGNDVCDGGAATDTATGTCQTTFDVP